MGLRSTLLFAIFCLFSIPFQAQNYELQWGPEYEYPGGTLLTNWGGFDEEGYHLLKQKFRAADLLSFDLNHELVGTYTLDLKEYSGLINFQSFLETQNGTFGIFQERKKRRGDIHTLIAPIEDYAFGELQSVYTQPHKARLSGDVTVRVGNQVSSSQDQYSHVTSSPAKNKVVITSSLNSRSPSDPEVLKVAVFDGNFEPLWEEVYPLGIADNEIQVVQAAVSNAGIAYFLVRQSLHSSGGMLSKKLPLYKYILHQVSSDDHQSVELPLEGNAAIQSARIVLSNEEEITVAGMYAQAENRKSLVGVFNLSIDQNFVLNQVRMFPFEPAFLEGLIKKRDSKKDQGLETDFLINSFFRFSDGTIGFIAEETYLKTGGLTGITTAHTDELVVATFTADLSSVNMLKIDKEFGATSPSKCSYSIGIDEEHIFLVYNNFNLETTGQKIVGKLTSPTEFIDLTVIDKQGNLLHQQNFFNSRDVENSYYPILSVYNENQLLLYMAGGKYLPLHFVAFYCE